MSRTKRIPSSPSILNTETFVTWAHDRNLSVSGAAKFALVPQTQYLYAYRGRQLPSVTLLVIAARSAGLQPPLAWNVPNPVDQIMVDLLGEDAANDPAVQACLLQWVKAKISK